MQKNVEKSVKKAAKKVNFNYSHSVCILLFALIPVENCFLFAAESLKVLQKTYTTHTHIHKQAMNQSIPKANAFTLYALLLYTPPLYSNYTCANKLHLEQ